MPSKTSEEIRWESLEQLKRLRPIDDIFMREMFRNNIELTQFTVRIITGISDLVVTEVHTQYDLHRLVGSRSLRIDVHAKDSADRRYSMEIERSDKGASPYRSRYISSAMDVEFLNAGDEFTSLPVSYVIFITENDIFEKGKLVYPIERMNLATGEPFNDGEHIIYLNSSYEQSGDNSELAELAHDFLCEDPDEMHLPLMADITRYYKTNPKGVEYMAKNMTDWGNELRQEGKHEALIETAIKMLKKGIMSFEDISEYSSLPLDEVKALAEKNRPAAT